MPQENIPIVIVDMVRKMNDRSAAPWQCENFKMTLENVQAYINEELAKYNKSKKR